MSELRKLQNLCKDRLPKNRLPTQAESVGRGEGGLHSSEFLVASSRTHLSDLEQKMIY